MEVTKKWEVHFHPPGAYIEVRENRMDQTTVAETIREQLGGSKFTAMTGAKDFLSFSHGEEFGHGLQFALPARSANGGINRVTVRLDPTDTYTVSFFRITHRGMHVTPVDVYNDVHAEDLRRIFTEATGLDTHL